MIGIIIPTLNRADFLIRQLRYYQNHAPDMTVYVGDSSDGGERARTLRAIDGIRGLHIEHSDCRGLCLQETIVKLISTVQEAYCVGAGDDDYLVPNSLRKCERFLEENLGYRTAQGRAIQFVLGNAEPYGKVSALGDYWNAPAAEENSACARLLNYASDYWVPHFSVHRTAEFLGDFSPFATLSDPSFSCELAPNFTAIARGKSKFIDSLYLARQVHERRYALPITMEWLASPTWYPAYKTLERELIDILVGLDGISEDRARAVVLDCFSNYLANSFKKQNPLSISPRTRLVRFIRRNAPALLQTAKSMRDVWLPSSVLTLNRLRQTASPYHADFAQIKHSLDNG